MRIVRKTPKMEVMELTFGKSIEAIILEGLVRFNGEQIKLAEDMGVSQGSLSRWIKELEIMPQVLKIRKDNGLPPSVRDLRQSDAEGKALLLSAVRSSCTKCNIELTDLIRIDIQGTTTATDETIVVVRDEMRRKHWFKVDVSAYSLI